MNRLIIITLILSTTLFSKDQNKLYLVVSKPTSVMLPNTSTLQLLEMKKEDQLDQNDPKNKKFLIAPYGGLNYLISKDSLKGINGLFGIVIGVGEVKGITENKFFDAILGAYSYGYLAADLQVNVALHRTKYRVGGTYVHGNTYFFLPLWVRGTAGLYYQDMTESYRPINNEDLTNEVGLDLSAALGIGVFELELGVEVGKQIINHGLTGLRPYGNLKVMLPLAPFFEM